uniref:non-specific serine/threonine protein kinase n=1 Tax=Chromera velia CCMP2878 TaxID=1169474 RepID=A0A0G4G211_9ALVE|eukprot:Cvel_19719.t1-p1 / transcript=Cvel_19719.t1 / gene=Cvel_19719 / organism=Chromera_velia_CCMP2878 / gene_product=Serine/threonine-protein kinase Nek1, putative / transcript_product=Serine/threonine-protein kinase Nek1, putative / location=Cvel_scaffold1722:25350-39269(+) / protein_length=2105 / sequence_SO=supercontig / SO=protein_coding / is_pseudo=false
MPGVGLLLPDLGPRNRELDFTPWGYEHVKPIGAGQFGQAHLVTSLDSGEGWIAKVIDVASLDERDRQKALQEAQFLKQLSSPFVVKIRESFFMHTKLVIIMEYCEGGDLADFLDRRRESGELLAESDILRYFGQLVVGLNYIHSQKIIHRDIKTSNIFLTNGRLKIGDFGIAKDLSGTKATLNATKMVGTPQYFSPEMCNSEVCTYKADVWALGCVLYELISLKPPFMGNSMAAVFVKILWQKVDPIPPHYSEYVRGLLRRMLAKDPTLRIDLVSILDDPPFDPFVPEEARGVVHAAPTVKQSGGKETSNRRSSEASNAEAELQGLLLWKLKTRMQEAKVEPAALFLSTRTQSFHHLHLTSEDLEDAEGAGEREGEGVRSDDENPSQSTRIPESSREVSVSPCSMDRMKSEGTEEEGASSSSSSSSSSPAASDPKPDRSNALSPPRRSQTTACSKSTANPGSSTASACAKLTSNGKDPPTLSLPQMTYILNCKLPQLYMSDHETKIILRKVQHVDPHDGEARVSLSDFTRALENAPQAPEMFSSLSAEKLFSLADDLLAAFERSVEMLESQESSQHRGSERGSSTASKDDLSSKTQTTCKWVTFNVFRSTLNDGIPQVDMRERWRFSVVADKDSHGDVLFPFVVASLKEKAKRKQIKEREERLVKERKIQEEEERVRAMEWEQEQESRRRSQPEARSAHDQFGRPPSPVKSAFFASLGTPARGMSQQQQQPLGLSPGGVISVFAMTPSTSSSRATPSVANGGFHIAAGGMGEDHQYGEGSVVFDNDASSFLHQPIPESGIFLPFFSSQQAIRNSSGQRQVEEAQGGNFRKWVSPSSVQGSVPSASAGGVPTKSSFFSPDPEDMRIVEEPLDFNATLLASLRLQDLLASAALTAKTLPPPSVPASETATPISGTTGTKNERSPACSSQPLPRDSSEGVGVAAFPTGSSTSAGSGASPEPAGKLCKQQSCLKQPRPDDEKSPSSEDSPKANGVSWAEDGDNLLGRVCDKEEEEEQWGEMEEGKDRGNGEEVPEVKDTLIQKPAACPRATGLKPLRIRSGAGTGVGGDGSSSVGHAVQKSLSVWWHENSLRELPHQELFEMLEEQTEVLGLSMQELQAVWQLVLGNLEGDRRDSSTKGGEEGGGKGGFLRSVVAREIARDGCNRAGPGGSLSLEIFFYTLVSILESQHDRVKELVLFAQNAVSFWNSERRLFFWRLAGVKAATGLTPLREESVESEESGKGKDEVTEGVEETASVQKVLICLSYMLPKVETAKLRSLIAFADKTVTGEVLVKTLISNVSEKTSTVDTSDPSQSTYSKFPPSSQDEDVFGAPSPIASPVGQLLDHKDMVARMSFEASTQTLSRDPSMMSSSPELSMRKAASRDRLASLGDEVQHLSMKDVDSLWGGKSEFPCVIDAVHFLHSMMAAPGPLSQEANEWMEQLPRLLSQILHFADEVLAERDLSCFCLASALESACASASTSTLHSPPAERDRKRKEVKEDPEGLMEQLSKHRQHVDTAITALEEELHNRLPDLWYHLSSHFGTPQSGCGGGITSTRSSVNPLMPHRASEKRDSSLTQVPLVPPGNDSGIFWDVGGAVERRSWVVDGIGAAVTPEGPSPTAGSRTSTGLRDMRHQRGSLGAGFGTFSPPASRRTILKSPSLTPQNRRSVNTLKSPVAERRSLGMHSPSMFSPVDGSGGVFSPLSGRKSLSRMQTASVKDSLAAVLGVSAPDTPQTEQQRSSPPGGVKDRLAGILGLSAPDGVQVARRSPELGGQREQHRISASPPVQTVVAPAPSRSPISGPIAQGPILSPAPSASPYPESSPVAAPSARAPSPPPMASPSSAVPSFKEKETFESSDVEDLGSIASTSNLECPNVPPPPPVQRSISSAHTRQIVPHCGCFLMSLAGLRDQIEKQRKLVDTAVRLRKSFHPDAGRRTHSRAGASPSTFVEITQSSSHLHWWAGAFRMCSEGYCPLVVKSLVWCVAVMRDILRPSVEDENEFKKVVALAYMLSSERAFVGSMGSRPSMHRDEEARKRFTEMTSCRKMFVPLSFDTGVFKKLTQVENKLWENKAQMKMVKWFVCVNDVMEQTSTEAGNILGRVWASESEPMMHI